MQITYEPGINFHNAGRAGIRRNHFICINFGNYRVCSKHKKRLSLYLKPYFMKNLIKIILFLLPLFCFKG